MSDSPEYIAVEGCILQFSDGGKAQILTPPSNKIKIDGAGAYFGDIEIMITGSSANGADANATGSATLRPTAQEVKSDGDYAVREGDEVTIHVVGTHYTPPATIETKEKDIKLTIQKANQSKIKAK